MRLARIAWFITAQFSLRALKHLNKGDAVEFVQVKSDRGWQEHEMLETA